MELKTVQISIDSDCFKILKRKEVLFNDVIYKKFQCTSDFQSAVDCVKVFKAMLPSQIELSVWKADLTRHAANAIVNAANEDLMHRGGLALALSRAGGPLIEEESRRFIQNHGKVKTGNIAITGGGRLPCFKIIHAVGPMWSYMNEQRCFEELTEVINNILFYVTKNGIKTVAIPAVSSGIFGFPLNLCVDTIVETIVCFPFHQTSNVLKEIHLVSNEEPTVDAFKKSCEKILSAALPLTSIILNNVIIQIIEGLIEKQKVDVIVNSVSAKIHFKEGEVSKAILNQAGIEIQKAFSKKLSETSKASELVIVTSGFKLSCKNVYHVVWPSSNFNRKKMLKDAVRKCLEKASLSNINSLSFPALGTGNIGLSKEEAVHIMLEEVREFSKNNPRKKLCVNFVVLPNDRTTSEAFISELAKMKTKKVEQMPLQENKDSVVSVLQWSKEGKKEAGFEGKLLFHLQGNNEIQLAAAEKWITKLQGQEVYFIENNYIFHLGKDDYNFLLSLQKTYEVSISENISHGKVALAIRGRPNDIIPVVLHVENLLWSAQMINTQKNEKNLSMLLDFLRSSQINKGSFRYKSDILGKEKLQENKKMFEEAGLEVQEWKPINNVFLETVFQSRKKIQSRKANGNFSLRLYQEVPLQFCSLIHRAGFQRLCSMPPDPQYGDGIYFSKNLKNLVDNFRRTSDSDDLIYVFEAEVAIGSYCEGNPFYISPPVDSRTLDPYDSVVDKVNNPETFVIFDSTQALPKILWICKLKKSVSSQV